MASVNKVILVGNLGMDPEVRYMPNGDPVAQISMATTEKWKDKNGAKQEKTEWHRVIFYRNLAEIVGEYLKKGRPIYVEGRLETRPWTDKNDIKRYTTQIVANNMQMLGSSQGNNASNDNDQSAGNSDERRHSVNADGMPPDYEDDIPF